MKKGFVVAILVAAGLILNTFAQRDNDKNTKEDQFVIYKWYKNGVANYTKEPPYGTDDYVMLNRYGVEIKNKRQDGGSIERKAARPIHLDEIGLVDTQMVVGGTAALDASDSKSVTVIGKESPRSGTVMLKQRCAILQKSMTILETKAVVYDDSMQEGLTPLTEEEITKKKIKIQEQLDQFCKPGA